MISDIGEGTFFQCSGLSGELTIPKNVTIIKMDTFCECTGLSGDLIIPDRVTNVEFRAFRDCVFTSLVIGKSVKQISLSLFETPVIYCKTPTPPDTGVGDDIGGSYRKQLKHIYVPVGSKEAYLAHPDWAVFKQIIEETDF